MRKLIIKHSGIKHTSLYHRLIKLMRLLSNADQTSPRGKRNPLKSMHSKQGQLLLQNFTVGQNISLYSTLISAGLIKIKLASNERLRKKISYFKQRIYHQLQQNKKLLPSTKIKSAP